MRVLLALALFLLAAALVAGAIALAARGSASQQATAAIAQRLGAQALIDPSLDRSLLLAREGVNLDDSLADPQQPARGAAAQPRCDRRRARG